MIKMYCIFAKESIDKMKGNRGKLAAMSGHAFLHSYISAIKRTDSNWESTLIYDQASAYLLTQKAFKIVLIVDSVAELKEIECKYKNICGTSLVTDAGLTVFEEPTTVCLGLGPLDIWNTDNDIKSLKVLI